ncbi:MAG TPA: alpha/beta fold hydrolase [Pyrinomonadaceae bacterium]|nr:alpha/beta fold hydrolase [Pyrinomonadaceae bacterium]
MKTLARILFIIAFTCPSLLAQNAIVPNENLVAEGIPTIPASLADVVGRYTEFRAASFSSWHPTKREMLITTRFGDTAQVHQVKFPGGDRRQLTFFPDRVGFGSFPPKGGDFFVFSKDSGGDEFFQGYRYDLATGNVTMLTDGKSRNTGGSWSNSGKWLAYQTTRRNGKDVDLYLVNPTDPKSDKMLLQLEGGGWGAADWSPDDRQILLFEFISANESYLWLVDTTAGTKSLLTPKGGAEKVAYGGAGFSKDGKGIYVTTDLGSEFQRLAYIDLATKQHKFLTDHIKWDVDEFDLSPDGKTIAFVTNEDGIARLHLLDTATGKEHPVTNLPIGQIFGIDWHENGIDLGFSMVSARSTSDAYSLDVKSGKVERWTFSETGGLNTDNFSEAELVRWKTFDDKMISGFLYLPPKKFTGPRPVVINIHGGPEGQARPGFNGRGNYFLNEMGVAIIFPNIRGSSGYGKTFLKLDNGFLREDSYKDINALLDWIKTRPELDADRIMVTGGSYGGHMTLAVATNYSDRIRSALSVVGPSNLVTFLKNTQEYRRDLRRVEYGDERDPKMAEYLEKTAPLNNVQKIKKPLFVVQGKNDPRVPASESEQMVAAVRKNGTPVWYLLGKDEGHGFAKKKNVDYQFYATIMFMQEHLLK